MLRRLRRDPNAGFSAVDLNQLSAIEQIDPYFTVPDHRAGAGARFGYHQQLKNPRPYMGWIERTRRNPPQAGGIGDNESSLSIPCHSRRKRNGFMEQLMASDHQAIEAVDDPVVSVEIQPGLGHCCPS